MSGRELGSREQDAPPGRGMLSPCGLDLAVILYTNDPETKTFLEREITRQPPGERMNARTVRFEMFRGTMASWDSLFEEAAEFATKLGPDRLITISHSEDDNDGVVAVWFWDDGSVSADSR